MIDVRIICTHDGLPTARLLERVFAAEERNVALHYGRAALEVLETTRAAPEAVLLLWSLDAQVSHYMWRWLTNTPSAQLVEVACGPGHPPFDQRRSPVIEFNDWNGQRAGTAWRALQERLRAVDRHFTPQAPAPVRALAALGAVSALAVVAALVLRVDEALHPEQNLAQSEPASPGVEEPSVLGGPLVAIEPASIDDLVVDIDPLIRARLASAPAFDDPLATPELAPDVRARRRNLIERLRDLTES